MQIIWYVSLLSFDFWNPNAFFFPIKMKNSAFELGKRFFLFCKARSRNLVGGSMRRVTRSPNTKAGGVVEWNVEFRRRKFVV